MMKSFEKLVPLLCGTFLVSIALFLAWKNYTPGTFLVGWDSLHPEFNFPLAIERAISGVWREEQGAGAIAAHSHMADLPRIFFLWLSSFVLPISFLRYFYVFICLILGPLGVYFFLKYFLKTYVPSFLGGLYYFLNLGTLQHFTVPFEMFQTAYAFLPWLFYLSLKFLREGGRRNLVFLSLVLILGTPMAYAATLFYTSFIGLFLFLLFYWLISANRIIVLKRLLVLLGLVLGLNSYWILPNIYSVARQSATIENAKINRLFSPEAFLRNKDYGTLPDILLHKNFLFSWRAYDFNENTYNDLLGVWNSYLAKPEVLNLGYLIAAISILGFILSLVKREKVGLALIPTLGIALFFLVNANPPVGALYSLLYERTGLFREGFRMPFTKVSFLFMFAMSFYFAYALSSILDLVKRFRFVKFFISTLLLGFFSFALVYFMLPAFSGNLINPIVRRNLPNQYFEVFKWFKGRPGRIAKLPMHTLWGWEYHGWKYEGSGFIQYGIENPILDRDYDRWSPYNENFYREAASALYANDNQAFENILEKYQVKYLLLDESVINAGGSEKLLSIPEIKKLLADSVHMKKVTSFGFLTIYQTDFAGEEISAPKKLFKESLGLDIKEALRESKLVVSENFKENRGFASAYNCDLKKLGRVSKENLGDRIIYRAEAGGVSCDYFNYPGLSHNQAYILRIRGENRQGRSLKIYLQNWRTNRMDLEELLPEGKFDESFVIYPSGEGEGYSLNLETRSFGRIAAENVIESIEFYNADHTFSPGPALLENNLTVRNVKKFGTWLYRVDVEGSGLIELGQGYEEGWLGIVRDSQSWSKLEHIMVNSWSNGFLVENSQSQSKLVATIYLVFWPQFLEYLGFVVLAGTLVLVLTKR